ncbi:MAG TPA: hypothetical protein VFC96_07250 [Anaerovoracaceae bacterium]|nr:hypothetical protein [Anaerovoracaceae bacterium]
MGAIIKAGGENVASPELVFLQLASKLDIHRLILLGMQLCSYPPGEPYLAITTKQKLKIFTKKTRGYCGRRKASRALKYIENGSASIMESLAYMILSLPIALGGYGLKGITLNHEIKLSGEGVNRLGQNRCFIDLYYRSEKIAVEYESYAFHGSPYEQGRDMIRATILGRQGISVMTLSTIQLYDRDACKDFALNLASRLEKRVQIRSKKFNQMHDSIRALLPRGNTAEGVSADRNLFI